MNEKFLGPKSWCVCGHLGDGIDDSNPNPMWRVHHGGIEGHGPCLVEGCDCKKFTWHRFIQKYQRWLNRRQ